MKRVSITDLKAKLSEHLAAVRSGEEVIVTDRGRPIARLGPVEGEREMESRLASLVRAGRLRPPTTPRLDVADLVADAAEDPDGLSLASLLEERRTGR
ncbi:MAG: type II toxin-antitoxin system Phd/YefM family antitoxin [Gemmatimonadota bacterium]